MWNHATFHTDKPSNNSLVPKIINHILLDFQRQLSATKTETYSIGGKISCLSRAGSVLRSQLLSMPCDKHSFSPPTRQHSLTPSTSWPWGQNTLQYTHETKLGLRSGGNCNGTDVTGANGITKKPNKQRNEVSRLLIDIRHTKHNEFVEINLRGLLLRKKRMRYSYVRNSMLLVTARTRMSKDHTVPNRERWMTATEGRYFGLRRSGPVWKVN